MTTPKPDHADARPLLGSFLGMGGLVVVLFPVLFSGVPPWWAVLLLTGFWLVLLVVGTRWFMRHPWRVAALPVVMLLVWIVTVAAGAAYLDWTA